MLRRRWGEAQVPLGGMTRAVPPLPAHRETKPRPVLLQGGAPQAHIHLGAGRGSRSPSTPRSQRDSHSPMAQHIPTLHQTSHSPVPGITGETEARWHGGAALPLST